VREEAGERRKEAIAAVAAEAGLPKREVFDAVVAAKHAERGATASHAEQDGGGGARRA
jgi:16S rRNA (cytidine1402-2'-O)-methyltransferase